MIRLLRNKKALAAADFHGQVDGWRNAVFVSLETQAPTLHSPTTPIQRARPTQRNERPYIYHLWANMDLVTAGPSTTPSGRLSPSAPPPAPAPAPASANPRRAARCMATAAADPLHLSSSSRPFPKGSLSRLDSSLCLISSALRHQDSGIILPCPKPCDDGWAGMSCIAIRHDAPCFLLRAAHSPFLYRSVGLARRPLMRNISSTSTIGRRPLSSLGSGWATSRLFSVSCVVLQNTLAFFSLDVLISQPSHRSESSGAKKAHAHSQDFSSLAVASSTTPETQVVVGRPLCHPTSKYLDANHLLEADRGALLTERKPRGVCQFKSRLSMPLPASCFGALLSRRGEGRPLRAASGPHRGRRNILGLTSQL